MTNPVIWPVSVPVLSPGPGARRPQPPSRDPRRIREEYVNIYYRGGNLLKLSSGVGGYVAFFDLKYANPHGRFDLVAVHWPSNGAIRKKQDGRRLVLVEAKYGDGAIADSAGIHAHIVDINSFLEEARSRLDTCI